MVFIKDEAYPGQTFWLIPRILFLLFFCHFHVLFYEIITCVEFGEIIILHKISVLSSCKVVCFVSALVENDSFPYITVIIMIMSMCETML